MALSWYTKFDKIALANFQQWLIW